MHSSPLSVSLCSSDYTKHRNYLLCALYTAQDKRCGLLFQIGLKTTSTVLLSSVTLVAGIHSCGLATNAN